MKDRIRILSGVVAVTLAVAGPVAAGPRAFESTVAPFDPSPHVMPVDFPKQYVRTTPYQNGKLENDGPGAGSRQWYDWLKLWLRPWANARQAFDNEAATFQETVRDDDAAFKAAFGKLNADKLAKFNSGHNTRPQELLLAYQNLRGKELAQGKTIKAAMSRADAAMERVKKDEALLAAQEDIEKKAAVSADKAAIEKEIADSKALVEKFTSVAGTAVDLAGSITDPAQFAMKSFGVVTGLILSAAIDDHMMELYILDIRLDELDKAIAAKQNEAASASLKEARHLVDASMSDYVKAIIEEQQIIDQETQQLDQLAGLEYGAKKSNEANVPDIFQTLRTVHYDVMMSGRALRKKCARYQAVMNGGPGKRADQLATDLDKLVSMAKSYDFADKEAWLSIAVDSERYMNKQGIWYPKEQKYVAGQTAALQSRVDALPTDAFVKQILSKL